MIDKSLRQYYESGQLVRPGKGRPGYGAKEEFEKIQAAMRKKAGISKEEVKKGTVTNEGLNKQLDELGIDRMKVQEEINKRQSKEGLSQLDLDKIIINTKKEFIDKAATDTKTEYTDNLNQNLLEGTTLGALKKYREQTGAVDYTDAIIRNAVKQNPEVEGIIKKSINKAKGLAASTAKNYTDQNTGNITIKSAAKGGAQSFVKNLIGKNLARTGLLTALGPLGLLIGNWAAGKVVDKFTGKKDEGMVSTFFNKIQADGDKFTSKFREPGSQAQWEADRELRQLEARKEYMLTRKKEGKNYSQKNLEEVTNQINTTKRTAPVTVTDYGFDDKGNFIGEGLGPSEDYGFDDDGNFIGEGPGPSKDYGFDDSGDFIGEGLTKEELDKMDSSGPSKDYGFDDEGNFIGEGLGGSPAPPAPTHYDEPGWSVDSGDSGDSGSSDSGSTDDGGWGDVDGVSYIAKGGLAQRAPRKSMLKGGRVDKALTGRSRDI